MLRQHAPAWNAAYGSQWNFGGARRIRLSGLARRLGISGSSRKLLAHIVLGQSDFVLQGSSGGDRRAGGVQAEELPVFALESLLPDVPVSLLCAGQWEEGTPGRLVAVLVTFRSTSLVEHASLVEE